MWHNNVKPCTPIFIVIPVFNNAPLKKRSSQIERCWVTYIFYKQHTLIKSLLRWWGGTFLPFLSAIFLPFCLDTTEIILFSFV